LWVDDETLDIAEHVGFLHCAPPGDQQAVWDAVALAVTRRLPAGRPLWSATLIDGVAQGGSAVVMVFHHALADGLGGLVVLEQLMDGLPTAADPGYLRRAPRHRELVMDAPGSGQL